MDTFSYRVFLTIVQYKSFQKAAELHHVTPPAISHVVKQLEKEFGFSLFIRNRHSITLTSSGEMVYETISDLIRKEDALHQLVSEINGLTKGHVRLGIFNSMCKYLPSVIRSFNEKYPHITFEIYQGSYEDIIHWIKNGTVDIGFLSKTVNPGFPFHEIFSDPLMCILNKNTKTDSDTEIRLESLADAPFVMQRESCDADAIRIMEKQKLEVRTVCHVVDDKTTVEMVKGGFGFAIMPLLTMYGLEADVKMLKIIPPDKRIIGISVRNEQELSPAVKRVFTFIKIYDFSD